MRASRSAGLPDNVNVPLDVVTRGDRFAVRDVVGSPSLGLLGSGARSGASREAGITGITGTTRTRARPTSTARAGSRAGTAEAREPAGLVILHRATALEERLTTRAIDGDSRADHHHRAEDAAGRPIVTEARTLEPHDSGTGGPWQATRLEIRDTDLTTRRRIACLATLAIMRDRALEMRGSCGRCRLGGKERIEVTGVGARERNLARACSVEELGCTRQVGLDTATVTEHQSEVAAGELEVLVAGLLIELDRTSRIFIGTDSLGQREREVIARGRVATTARLIEERGGATRIRRDTDALGVHHTEVAARIEIPRDALLVELSGDLHQIDRTITRSRAGILLPGSLLLALATRERCDECKTHRQNGCDEGCAHAPPVVSRASLRRRRCREIRARQGPEITAGSTVRT